MGVKIKLKKLIIEIEYLLLIAFLVSSISGKAMNYLDKYYICLLFAMYHELAHILVGTLLNKKLIKVFIGICGMTAYFKYEYKNKNRWYYFKDFIIFIAGPVANLIVASIFIQNKFVFEINIFLAILNLLPIYPLDGFNSMRAILKCRFINNNMILNKISMYISMFFLIFFSLVCIVVLYKYKNISSIVFLTYILIINIGK